MHARVVDAGLALVVAALTLPVTIGGAGVLEPGTGVTGLGWLWFIAIHVPLIWRRQAPVIVFWVVLGLVGVCALTGYTGVFMVFVPLFALYAVARYCPQRQLWPGVAAGLLIIAALGLPQKAGWPVLIGIFSTLVVAALLGVTIQLRRTYLDERTERLRQEALAVVSAERARIARDVHDIVAHNLVVMVALADGAAANPPAGGELMAQAASTGRQALSEMRRLVGLLRDGESARAPQPGFEDLDELVAQVRAAGLRVVVTQEGAGTCSPGVGLAVYRIVQEALTNTLKHAGPGVCATVHMRFGGDDVELEITDDGTARPRPSGGHGLAGISERAAAYGGEVEAGPLVGSGWRVRARVPLTESEA